MLKILWRSDNICDGDNLRALQTGDLASEPSVLTRNWKDWLSGIVIIKMNSNSYNMRSWKMRCNSSRLQQSSTLLTENDNASR